MFVKHKDVELLELPGSYFLSVSVRENSLLVGVPSPPVRLLHG